MLRPLWTSACQPQDLVFDGAGRDEAIEIRFAQIPIIFAETHGLAQEWAYRFFGAAVAENEQEVESVNRVAQLSAQPRQE